MAHPFRITVEAERLSNKGNFSRLQAVANPPCFLTFLVHVYRHTLLKCSTDAIIYNSRALQVIAANDATLKNLPAQRYVAMVSFELQKNQYRAE